MIADLVLVECERRGVTLEVREGRLLCRGAEDAVSPDLLATIRQHKSDLIDRIVAAGKARETAISPIPSPISPPLGHRNPASGLMGDPNASAAHLTTNNSFLEEKESIRPISPPNPGDPSRCKSEAPRKGNCMDAEMEGDLGYASLYNPSPPTGFGGLIGLAGSKSLADQGLNPSPVGPNRWPNDGLAGQASGLGASPDDPWSAAAAAEPSDPLGRPYLKSAWSWIVANWPHDRWSHWRRRASELLPDHPTPSQITLADHAAYLELAAEPLTPSPIPDGSPPAAGDLSAATNQVSPNWFARTVGIGPQFPTPRALTWLVGYLMTGAARESDVFAHAAESGIARDDLVAARFALGTAVEGQGSSSTWRTVVR